MKEIYLVTGASSGIGYALCCHLARRHKKVLAIARRESSLIQLKNEYPDYVTIFPANLSQQTERERVIASIDTDLKIAGLVNNAASVDPLSRIQNISLEAWHQQIAINLDAPLFLTQGLLPFLEGGRVINITTGSTGFALSGVAGYAMTKAALNTFSRFLHTECQDKNIFVTSAHPSVVKTDMVEHITEQEDTSLGIVKAQKAFKKDNRYLDVNIPAKFLCWLLLDAETTLFTGDIIGIYNKKYQPLWHNEIIPSPYPANVTPP